MNAPAIVPALELIRRTLHCEVSYTLSRMRVLEQMRKRPIRRSTSRA